MTIAYTSEQNSENVGVAKHQLLSKVISVSKVSAKFAWDLIYLTKNAQSIHIPG